MKLTGMLAAGRRLPEFTALVERLGAGEVPAAPLGIYHAARPYLTALLALERTRAEGFDRPLLVVTARSSRARQLGR